ncbi:MAG: GNAT family N-acetyltransferase [Ferruginibacter sp.]
MLIQNEITATRGIFFIEVENEKLAALYFSLSPGIMTINHTEVDEKLAGKNIGLQLVNHAVDYARTNNLKIIPLCPFAKKVFDKRPDEYQDVLLK